MIHNLNLEIRNGELEPEVQRRAKRKKLEKRKLGASIRMNVREIVLLLLLHIYIYIYRKMNPCGNNNITFELYTSNGQ